MHIVAILYARIVAIQHILSIKFKEKSSSIYTYFFCLNVKSYWFLEKNNTAFF
jgi:hypothetical protein